MPVVCDSAVALAAELLEQCGDVLFVGSSGEFPVDVESVEQSGSRNPAVPVAAHVALDEPVDRGSGQRRASSRSAGGLDESILD